MNMNDKVIDDQGTTPDQARKILESLLTDGFEGDHEKLAVALGRNTEEIHDFFALDSQIVIDEDLVMKMRGLAQAREIEIE
jgi:hypothetical protein